MKLEGITLDVNDEGRQPATIRLGDHTYYQRRDGWRCATHGIEVTGAGLVALLDRALATARRTPEASTRSPITAWLRNAHAGARHEEPYPSGDGEPVHAGADRSSWEAR